MVSSPSLESQNMESSAASSGGDGDAEVVSEYQSHSPLASSIRFGFGSNTSGEMNMLVSDFEDLLGKNISTIRSSNPNVQNDKMLAALVTALGNIMRKNISIFPAGIPRFSLVPDPNRAPVRVYMDGCFDIMHSGHYNAIRQAKTLGDILVVGVHSDSEIRKHKGPPVMNEEERMAAVRDCKWIDEMVFDTPYNPSLELLNRLNCDFCVHGDDMPSTADGKHAYSEVEQAGRLRIIKRTEGVSTTDLLGRLLLMTKDHHLKWSGSVRQSSGLRDAAARAHSVSGFLPTTWRISQFANNRTPADSDTIVYIVGSFDLFHVGHIEALKRARHLGDFLYVGVHDDETVNRQLGNNFPIMNLHERVLNVLSCRWVDEVILGAPHAITPDLIHTLNISVVAGDFNLDSVGETDMEEQLRVPTEMGIVRSVKADRQLLTGEVVRRIVANRLKYEQRNSSRTQKEKEYAENRKFVSEL